jgi:hypothetical protein
MLNFSFQSANGIMSFISMFQIPELMGCRSNHQSLFNKVFFSKDVSDISIALVEYGSQNESRICNSRTMWKFY